MGEVDKYNNLVDYVYSNFKFRYYPSSIFVSDCLDVVGSADPEHLDCVIYDLSKFYPMLTTNHTFNNCLLEVLFMFLTHEEGVTDEMDQIMEEYESIVFESLVSKENVDKYMKTFTKDKINNILKELNSMIKREGLHALAVGWLISRRGDIVPNYNLGVVYV